MKGFTSFKELNLGLTDTHLIIPLVYRRKKRYSIKSDLAFWHRIKYQIVRPSGYSQALLPHWIIYRSVCACSNETQQLYKPWPLHCTTEQDPSLTTALNQIFTSYMFLEHTYSFISICEPWKRFSWSYLFLAWILTWLSGRLFEWILNCSRYICYLFPLTSSRFEGGCHPPC